MLQWVLPEIDQEKRGAAWPRCPGERKPTTFNSPD
jgi:hypothetical protein